MNHRFVFLFVIIACVVLFPFRSPAPLTYTPGEGWYYESYGESTKWQSARAKDQLDVAQQAFDKHDYGLALRAAHRIVRVWPLSDYAPRAQYLIGRCLEVMGKDEEAFNAYQVIVEKYPKSAEYEDVLWRQYQIANRFLGGEWFKLWGFFRFTIRWIKQRACLTKSFRTVLTAMLRRMRNCALARRAKNRRIFPKR